MEGLLVFSFVNILLIIKPEIGAVKGVCGICVHLVVATRVSSEYSTGLWFSLTFVVHLTLFVGFRLRRDFEEIAFLRGDEMAAYRRDCDVLSSRIGAATRGNDAGTTKDGVSATIDSKLRRILTVTWMNARRVKSIREKHLFEQITINLRAKLTKKRAPD